MNIYPKYPIKENIIYSHNSKETLDHLIMKTILFFVLRSKGRKVFIEFALGDAVIDVFDSTENRAYEIESKATKNTWKEKQAKINPNHNKAMPTVTIIHIPKIIKMFGHDWKKVTEYFIKEY